MSLKPAQITSSVRMGSKAAMAEFDSNQFTWIQYSKKATGIDSTLDAHSLTGFDA